MVTATRFGFFVKMRLTSRVLGDLATALGIGRPGRIDEVACFVGGLGTVARAERAQQRGHVYFRRRLSNFQRTGDLLVGHATCQKLEHLTLALRQLCAFRRSRSLVERTR